VGTFFETQCTVTHTTIATTADGAAMAIIVGSCSTCSAVSRH